MKFAVLDFETTGSQPTDEIIQVGLVIIDQFQIIDRYTSLVHPGMGIPSSITTLTGITDEMVADAPTLDQVMSDMFPLLFDCVLVAHHAAFDVSFLQRGLTKTGYPPFSGRVLDTMDMLRILFPSISSLQLSMVAGLFGIDHERPHQADSDAEVTAEIWIRCLERLIGLPLLTVQRLQHIFENSSSDLGWFLDEICLYKESITSIDTDTNRYFRQFTLNVTDWGEEDDIRGPSDEDGLGASFKQFHQGLKLALQQKFEIFEERESQEQMIYEVEKSLENDQHLMIEAGTGTGKSLGYLIPALYYGIKYEKKVVVSTHTINLQEQLRERDIPLLKEIFPVPFRAAVLKGRSHYLCLRKFETKLTTRDYENGKEDPITAAQMVVWLSETEHGDEEEIHFGNKGAQFWYSVASDTDSCLNRMCPWYKKCFYHRARNDANTADVIITNHSLLFTDMKAENRLLPAYKHLVIDEAHHFEEVASKHLGIELHSSAMYHSLTWLYKDNRSGQLPMLRFRLQKSDEQQERAAAWSHTIDGLFPKIVQIKEDWDRLSESLYELLSSKSDPSQTENSTYVLRMKPETLPANWHELLTMEDNIYLNANDLLRTLDKLLSDVKEHQDVFGVQGLVTDLNGTVKELYEHRDALHFFMKMADDGYVYWMEAGTYARAKSLQLISVPTDVSGLLQQHFFETKESIIMTSATLSVNKSFQYSADQLGLVIPQDEESGKLKTVQLPSPFNYREQALVVIPRDFPTIKGAGDPVFIASLIESLSEVAIVTKGRMLILFTSNRMLKQIYAGMKDYLKAYGITVLGQGVDSGNRSKLTRMFQDNKMCVLLGTSSFWEGVDIPGDALSCLAIIRLPFQPPNHPLVEAKCENIKKRNENPFMKFSVPQAVIRFKQGFGRLVRRASDKGIVIIYDTRVIETFYGKHFLYSLPGPKIEHMTTEQMLPRIEQWMGEA
ncbi:ATP-dependent DNA helicase DinG [Paenibacillus sp. CGMCC 1.16610]|uniref:3'-5' exonuclease DinG n=1 Tax=Paenibacillus anseongense TaxID=2682845 RepID=A0ABW9U7R8_9BACL|nr:MULTISPECIES: ATP-dependent DNA helicase DinG [Paenibacillus]MBA2942321.1 ATP-dependent DNA helicase DinG [Paenibacillus sp. CGMCC 1.16610]MVQ36152.1 ATP-dependent DNA helicase DinG [Paenibacillus anseongense]